MSEIDFVVLMSKWPPFRTAGSRGAAFSMLLDFRLPPVCYVALHISTAFAGERTCGGKMIKRCKVLGQEVRWKNGVHQAESIHRSRSLV